MSAATRNRAIRYVRAHVAAHADITLFDEPYAGLDASARELFYDQLLADYTAHPRCIVLCTLGAHTTAVMAGQLDERDRELADHPALRLDRLTLQQLAIYAAGNHDRLDLTERETAR